MDLTSDGNPKLSQPKEGGPLMWAFISPAEIALKHDAKAFEKVLERDRQHGIVSSIVIDSLI